MALVKGDKLRRVEVHDGWIDIHGTLTVGDVRAMAKGENLNALMDPTPEMMFSILRSVIVAWSYDDPVTPENIDLLDFDATTSVFEAFSEMMGVLNPKKEETTSEPLQGGNGLENSPISVS